MARTTTAPRRAALEADATPREEPVGLELIGVGLCLASLLLLAALLTYVPDGTGRTFANVAGALGRAVAGALLRALGIGALAFPLPALVWGIGCLSGRSPRNALRRSVLVPLMATLLAMEGALLVGTSSLPGLSRTGPGGYLGVALGSSLFGVLGKASGLVAGIAFLGVLRHVVGISYVSLARRAWTRLGWADATAVEGEEAGLEEGDEEEVDEPAGAAAEEPVAEEPPPPARIEARRAEPLPEDDASPTPRRRPRPPRRPPVRASKGPYVFPPTNLLAEGVQHDDEAVREEVEHNAKVLGETLASFGVEARVVSSLRGPVITFYEIAIGTGVRLNRVTALADDLAIALKAPSVRIVAPIPGRSTVGVEVPNLSRDTVAMRDLVEETREAAERKSIPIFLGRDTAGRPLVEDLASMPHILIAGATGSGKSVCINSVLLSIVYSRTPEEVKLILIDPKQVELSFFEGIPHLLTPVVTDMKRAAQILEWAVDKMDERYSLLLAAGVRNITGYNGLDAEKVGALRERTGMDEVAAPDHLPHIVIVVDELADLMMTSGKEVELAITRLAQKSRAVGIHIILATQRPSTNVITGLIKANMPTRIAFHVSSKIDSRVILDANGADKLLGMGDMLLMHPRSLHLRRAQGTLVTDAEARDVVTFLKEHCPPPEYRDLLETRREGLGDPMEEDDLYEDAVRVVLSTRLGSASMLQRRLSIGYTRASRLIDMMSDHGVVGPHVGSKARECLLKLEEWEAQQAEAKAAGAGADAPGDPDEIVQDTNWE